MILSIPYQTLEVNNIHLTPFQLDKYGKAIARLSYKDNSIDFQDVSILTPPLRVIDYNPENSRMRLDLSDQIQFQMKINTLQEYLVNTFHTHQQSFLNINGETSEDIRKLFHFLLEGNSLSLYVFPTTHIKKNNDNKIYKFSEIKPGDTMRCIIRLHGISQIKVKNGIRLRLQHTIPSTWVTDECRN
jgi:hypothetical protein